MCGRYTLHCTSEELDSYFDLIPGGFREERRYNIAPGQWVIVIRPDKDRKRTVGAARWGLVPSWAKDPASGPKPINARAEGILDKPTFRNVLKRGRCLIPASGFYEWKATPTGKQPFYIKPVTGLFAFAGIADSWSGPGGELETCANTTTRPNELMAPIHDRMPVILPKESWEAWLDPALSPSAAVSMLIPFPAIEMLAYPVGAAVGRVENDGPELLRPLGEAGHP
jgi:putative SOS response-associated peptidase YedK